MNFNEYQIQAKQTAIYKNQGNNIFYPTLGLVGEAGELANRVKKIMRGDFTLEDEHEKHLITSEIGDILWYCAQVATELNISLNEIAKNNLSKLFARKINNEIKGSGENRCCSNNIEFKKEA